VGCPELGCVTQIISHRVVAEGRISAALCLTPSGAVS
jgi:hypothetical protein